MSNTAHKESVTWNLSDLYSDLTDPKLSRDKEEVGRLADAFVTRYKGKLAQLSSQELAQALRDLENIHDLVGKIGSFAYLAWSTNTNDTNLGKELQFVNEFSSQLHQKLVFFDIEWLALDESIAESLIKSPDLKQWSHFLASSRRYKQHTLSEKEEQLLSAKGVTGARAWIRYFDETLGAARFDWDGEEKTEQEILSKLYDTDRGTRKKASDVFTQGLGQISRSLTFVFNTLLADKASNDKFRGYPTWISSRNLSNEITDDSVDALVNSVVSYYPVVQRYYVLKKRLLGYDALFDYDRYAPISKSQASISWTQAKDMVLESYYGFNQEMGSIAELFFDKNWIDAALAPGKRSGAYAASTVPSVHPYVFMNFQGRLRDVQTLAHELGHGIHQYLSRKQGPLQADTPLTTAETASVFGEMLVFQNMLSRIQNPKERLTLLVEKIDDTIATVFRQISMNRFEAAMHTARREEGELSKERFSELWFQTQTDLYGDSVTLSENYKTWWMYIPHFLHTPGYVYAYAFGELLVLTLYEAYKNSRPNFEKTYLDVLSAGGSEWPDKLMASFDFDIASSQFWKQGLNLFEQMVADAETLEKQD